MKFLIAGFGSAGRRHLRNLLALGEQDILLYRSGHSTLPLEELESYPVFTNLHQALEEKPDAVIVANITSAHLDVAIPAARQGCHILMEKPISHSLERLDDLQSAINESGSKVLVGYQFRFHPCFKQIRRWLEEGTIGRPLSARAHYGDYMPGWHPWEDYRTTYSAVPGMGGGAVLTLCHPIDYLRWFLGEVENVYAFTGNIANLDIHSEDVAEILLQFGNGAVGSIHLDYYQRPPSYRFEIIGTDGTVKWDHADNFARLFRAKTGCWEMISAPSGFERNDLFKDEIRHFINMIKWNEEPNIPLEDGIQVLKIALAALESGSRKRPIQL